MTIGKRSDDNTSSSICKNISKNNYEHDLNLPQSSGIRSANASFGNMSRLALMRAKNGSFVAHEPSLPLNNSFVTLANSFATNLVPGLLQHTIVPPDFDLVMTSNEDDSDADFDSPCESVHSDQTYEVNSVNCNIRACRHDTSAALIRQSLCERSMLSNSQDDINIQITTHFIID